MVDYDVRRWLPLILRVRGSVLPALLPRLLVTAAIAALAAWLFRHHGVRIPTIAHTLVGVALGLLLVFRTNTAYDRYWEGRRLFGLIVNRSRDLARQIVGFLPDAADAAERETLLRHVRLHSALVRLHVRRDRNLAALPPGLLTADELAALEPLACRPNAPAAWISARLAAAAAAGRLSEQRLMLLDGNLTTLADCLGGAERILKTPIPFAYAHHIKLFLTLFCFTAPFAMAEAMGWLTPPAAVLLAFGMFGIDEIGVEIEDPFGTDANDLPLDRIGETIDDDVRALAALEMR